ncbi:hypothetical protein JCM3774_006463 [Rhodotorula dairenensis]
MTSPAPPLDAEQPSAALVRPVSLPDEVWTTIFEQLEFFDLRTVEMVCKHFQDLLKGHQLASILFRAGPQEPIKEGQELNLHPLLGMVDCVGTESGNPGFATLVLGRTIGNAYDFAAVDDLATRPACIKIRINMANTDVGTVRCTTGATIRQILRKTIPFWLWQFDDCFEGHVWWNGWISAVGQQDGSVLLKSPGCFDS